jgi:O-acetyl-ADP-ribose deacetylase (regulator of RNase III)
MEQRIELIQGDITRLDVDAIVNAANNSLLGGGGVDGAIHRAAGPDLLEYNRKLEGCPTGEARLTPGFRLKVRYIIHTVGPIWHGGNKNEELLLAKCYQGSLELAEQHQCRIIAFPNISTGIYGFPKEKAANIAIRTVQEFQEDHNLPEKVIFVCFDHENYAIYLNLLQEKRLEQENLMVHRSFFFE